MAPLSDRLHLSDAFRGQVNARHGILAQRGRLDTLNRRLDDLARCLGSNGRHNPNRLDFKRLKGDPRPPSTHEFDIWSGLGNRGFGHYEIRNGEMVFVVDAIGGHL